jgi:hypothetical protein
VTHGREKLCSPDGSLRPGRLTAHARPAPGAALLDCRHTGAKRALLVLMTPGKIIEWSDHVMSLLQPAKSADETPLNDGASCVNRSRLVNIQD